MATRETEKFGWKLGGQATVTNTSATAFDLAYGTNWATAAQNPANRPDPPPVNDRRNLILTAPFAAPIDVGAGIRLRFLVADAVDEEVTCKLWTWDEDGAPMDTLFLNPIRAGTSVCEVHPITKVALTNFRYADVLTVATNGDHTGMTAGVKKIGTDAGNGLLELRWDTMGATAFYPDFDINEAGGTAGTDAICLYKEYG